MSKGQITLKFIYNLDSASENILLKTYANRLSKKDNTIIIKNGEELRK